MLNARMPDDGPLIATSRKRGFAILAVWTGIALFFMGQSALRYMLHAVSMLNFSDVDAANRRLVRLSDLLRLSGSAPEPQDASAEA